MVVTFVIGSLEYIGYTLDRKRLNKQKVEANQILKASLGLTKGWVNHPAVLMWKGYPNALKHYFNEITHACIYRGFKNNMEFYEFSQEQINNIEYQTIQDYLDNGIPTEASIDKIIFPWWFQWKPLIYSHQASLLRKNSKYYDLSFYMFDDYEFDRDELSEYLELGYLWPHKLSREQIENFSPSYCDEIGTGAPATYRWTRDEVEEWLNDMYTNPKTGRSIKPSKTGVYSDLKKASKLYGYDVDVVKLKENKDIISNNNNMNEYQEEEDTTTEVVFDEEFILDKYFEKMEIIIQNILSRPEKDILTYDILDTEKSRKNKLLLLKEKQYQMKVGEIWQEMVGNYDEFINLKSGHQTKLDILSNTRKLAIELKNRTNTDNSSSRKSKFDDLSKFKKENPEYTCIYANINANTEKKTLMGSNEKIIHNGVEIEHQVGYYFLTFIFGEKTEEIIEFIKNTIDKYRSDYI